MFRWFGAFAILLATLLASCHSVRYVPVESVRRDTVYQSKVHRDSVYLRDSVLISKVGDTVTVYKYRYLYRDRIKLDTVFRSRTDTVSVPYPVEVKLTPWQRVKQEIGGLAIGGIVLMALVIVGWMVFRSRRK